MTRGDRLNNPGNIRLTDDKWEGMSETQPDSEFVNFDSKLDGARALGVLLKNYQNKHNLNTIKDIVSRYAPPSENDTDSYVDYVSKSLGIGSEEPLDISKNLSGLIKTISKRETGTEYDKMLTSEAARLALGGKKFNYSSAEKEASKSDILNYVRDNNLTSFNIDKARTAGVSDDEIYKYVSSPYQRTTTPEPEEITATPEPEEVTTIPEPEPEDVITPEDVTATMATTGVPMVSETGEPEIMQVRKGFKEFDRQNNLDEIRSLRGSRLSGLETQPETVTYIDPETGELVDVDYGAIEDVSVDLALLFVGMPTAKIVPMASKTAGVAGKKLVKTAANKLSSEEAVKFYGTVYKQLSNKTEKAIDLLSPRSAMVANKNLISRLGISADKADDIYKRWGTVMNPSKNEYADRVKSLLDYAGKQHFHLGAKTKLEVSAMSDDIQRIMETEIRSRRKAILDLTKKKYKTFAEAADDIEDVRSTVYKDYEIVKNSIANIPVKKPVNIAGDINVPENIFKNLPESVRSDIAVLKHLAQKESGHFKYPEGVKISKEGIYTHDLMDGIKAINSLRSKPGVIGTSKGYNLKQLKYKLTKALKDSLPVDKFDNFEIMQAEYSRMKTVENSQLGTMLTRLVGKHGKLSAIEEQELMKKLPSLAESRDTFYALKHMIGTERTAKLETKLIDSILDRADPYAWDKLRDVAGSQGFVSQAGKNLQALITKLDDSFKVDSKYNIVRLEGITGEGSKTSVTDAALAIMVKDLLNLIAGLLPTASGTAARAAYRAARQRVRLSRILSDPSTIKKFDEAIEKIAIPKRTQMFKDAVKKVKSY